MPSASTCPERVRAGVALAALAAATAAATVLAMGSRQQSPDATFRSATDLVVLQLVVVDQQGRTVSGLGLDDFAVYDEGLRQAPMLFATSTTPLDLVVLLDTSASMAERLPLAQKATIGLLRALREDDEASVVLFSDGVRVAQPLTGDRRQLEAAVLAASAGGATALYEALYVSVREVARGRQVSGALRRQAIVVLSDGDDNRSRVVGFEDVLDAARRSAVTIFSVTPGPAAVPPPSTLGRPPATLFEMRQLAEETGGRAFVPAAATELARVYEDIAGELSQQYWLAYTPPPAAREGVRRVAVRIESQPGLRARTRAGYYAAPAPARRGATR
jgi:Ca-activated chloride channel family protein